MGSMPADSLAYHRNVAKRRGAEEERPPVIPPSTLKVIAGLVEKKFEETGFTAREAAAAWRMSTFTLSKLRNSKPDAIGVETLLRLRELLRMPIDQILQLEPLEVDVPVLSAPGFVVEQALRGRTGATGYERAMVNKAEIPSPPASKPRKRGRKS